MLHTPIWDPTNIDLTEPFRLHNIIADCWLLKSTNTVINYAKKRLLACNQFARRCSCCCCRKVSNLNGKAKRAQCSKAHKTRVQKVGSLHVTTPLRSPWPCKSTTREHKRECVVMHTTTLDYYSFHVIAFQHQSGVVLSTPKWLYHVLLCPINHWSLIKSQISNYINLGRPRFQRLPLIKG